MLGQPLHLLDVENSVAFEEGDFAGSLLAGVAVRLAARDLRGVDDERPLLALAHMRAKLPRLPIEFPGVVQRHVWRGRRRARPASLPLFSL